MASRSLRRRVIIDTDPGIDDMMALALALNCENLSVEGITIVFGNNNNVDMLASNACFALKAFGGCGKADGCKVVIGASEPKKYEYYGHSGIEVHGENGLGGIFVPAIEIDHSPLQHNSSAANAAAQFMVDTCAANPGEITIIALGPLTNVAAAMELDPRFRDNVKNVTLMGATFNGRGNVTACAEANIHNDPDAAAIVLAPCAEGGLERVTIAPLDVTHQVDLKPLRQKLRTVNDAGYFLYSITRHYVDLLTLWQNTLIPVHDACAVMAVAKPELFSSSFATVAVETAPDALTRGVTVADFKGIYFNRPEGKVHRILTTVDQQDFSDIYVAAIAKIPYKSSFCTLDEPRKHDAARL